MTPIRPSSSVSILDYHFHLEKLPIPASIIATISDRGDECTGRHRRLHHNKWKIVTAHNARAPNSPVIIDFDVAIDFPSIKLTHPDHIHDLLTKKIFCLEMINNSDGNRNSKGETSLYKNALFFDWVLRWRNSVSVYRFSELGIDHFDACASDFECADILESLPIIDRLDVLMDDPNFILPLRRHGNKQYVSYTDLAEILGVTSSSLGRSKIFRTAFDLRAEIFASRLPPDVTAENLLFKKKKPLDLRTPRGMDANGKIAVWQSLDVLSGKNLLVHDALQFRIRPTDYAQRGKKEGLNVERTTTLLPHDLIRLLRAAAEWVFKYGDYILDAIDLRARITLKTNRGGNDLLHSLHQRIDETKPEGIPPLGLSPRPGAELNKDRLSITTAVRLLFTALGILLGGFTARRRGEIEALWDDCIEKRGNSLYLNVYIEKTFQDVDSVLVPGIVEYAVHMLKRLSKEARETTGTRELFQFSRVLDDGVELVASAQFARYMLEFVTFVGLAPPAGSKVWKLHYHMLRKGDSVTYFHGNLWGSFDELNRLLRHLTDKMTQIYTDDSDRGAVTWLHGEVKRLNARSIEELSPREHEYLKNAKDVLSARLARGERWNEARQEHYVSKWMAVYDGSDHPIGKGGSAILDELKLYEKRAYARIHFKAARSNSESGPREHVVDQVKEAAAVSFMEPIPGNFGFCLFCRGNPSHTILANCLTDREAARRPWSTIAPNNARGLADFAFSGLYPCLSCALFAALEDDQKVLEEIVEGGQKSIAGAATPQMKKSAELYVDEIINLIDQARKETDGKRRKPI